MLAIRCFRRTKTWRRLYDGRFRFRADSRQTRNDARWACALRTFAIVSLPCPERSRPLPRGACSLMEAVPLDLAQAVSGQGAPRPNQAMRRGAGGRRMGWRIAMGPFHAGIPITGNLPSTIPIFSAAGRSQVLSSRGPSTASSPINTAGRVPHEKSRPPGDGGGNVVRRSMTHLGATRGHQNKRVDDKNCVRKGGREPPFPDGARG